MPSTTELRPLPDLFVKARHAAAAQDDHLGQAVTIGTEPPENPQWSRGPQSALTGRSANV